MQSFRRHGCVGEPAPSREDVFGALPPGETGRHGRERMAVRRVTVDPAPRWDPDGRQWVDQDFEEPFLE